MGRRFRRPGRSISAYAGTACGIWTFSLWGCGDFIGVGSLSGNDAAPAAAAPGDEAGVPGADAARDDAALTAVDAGLGALTDAVAPGAGSDSDDGPETTGCPPDSGAQWIPWSDPARPMGAFYVGLEPMTGSDPDAGSYYYYVCRARDANNGGDIIPGVFVDGTGCFYTPDGIQQFQSANFDVLLDPNHCLSWTTYDGGLATAFVGGWLGQDPLSVCAAPLSPQAPWRQAGYLDDVSGGSCRVPTRGGSPEDIANDVFIVTQ